MIRRRHRGIQVINRLPRRDTQGAKKVRGDPKGQRNLRSQIQPKPVAPIAPEIVHTLRAPAKLQWKIR